MVEKKIGNGKNQITQPNCYQKNSYFLLINQSINQPISYKKIKLAIERAELTGKKKKKEEEIF